MPISYFFILLLSTVDLAHTNTLKSTIIFTTDHLATEFHALVLKGLSGRLVLDSIDTF